MLLASQNLAEVSQLVEQFQNYVLLVVDELGQELDELCPGSGWAQGSTDLFKLLDRVESLFGVLVAEIVQQSGDLVFLFHSSILQNYNLIQPIA